jgi:inositol transport system substrate-binding protein
MAKSARLVLLIVLGALLVGGVSCAPGARKYRIAYVARAQGDSFAAWLANSMVAEAKKYPDLSVTVFDGQSRNELIASHIENAVTNRYDLVLIQPLDSEAQVAPAKTAIAAGVKVMTCNNRINDPGIPGIDADPIQQAAENAKLAVTQVPKNARVVVLLGPAGNMHSLKRREGWQTYFFNVRPDVTIVGEQIANWNKDEAMRFMEDWIQSQPRIDAVISMNDNMAVGAIEAVKGSGAKAYPLAYGVDGTPEACLCIKGGSMTSTTLQSAYALATKSMQMAHDLLTGKMRAARMDFITAELITKDNVDEYIQMHRDAGNMR